jgi:hypothetical protein
MKIGTRLKITDSHTVFYGATVGVVATIREGRYHCQVKELPTSSRFERYRKASLHPIRLGSFVFVSDGQYEVTENFPKSAE